MIKKDIRFGQYNNLCTNQPILEKRIFWLHHKNFRLQPEYKNLSPNPLKNISPNSTLLYEIILCRTEKRF